MDLFDAVAERRSVRGFRSSPVSRQTMESLFTRAQRAPSWCNVQPWRVVVTSGEVTERLRTRLLRAFSEESPSPEIAMPPGYPEPYGTHRRECGRVLYEAMGIERKDATGKVRAWRRNFELFDAPHAVIVSFDDRFGIYGALDVGCWLQTVLLGAVALGLACCPQAALASYPSAVREVLPIAEGTKIAFGISIGVEDPDVPANRARTSRAPLEDNVKLLGFET
ncbi:MAG: nitroreductase [Deltaproteobacteria bacterium]|nr:nitroreductase [Deltaproteobacteria bacterium]